MERYHVVAMDADPSVTQWILGVTQGDTGEAQERLLERFLHRLTALARTRLRHVHGVDTESDVALSAMKSFFLRAPKHEFEQLHDRDSLWSLLAAITIKKSISARRRMLAQKRDVRRDIRLDELLHAGPTRDFLDSVYDEGNRLLEEISEPTQREVARLRLEGFSNEEIAEKIGRSIKTVERKLNLVRKRLRDVMGQDDD